MIIKFLLGITIILILILAITWFIVDWLKMKFSPKYQAITNPKNFEDIDPLGLER